MREAVGILGGTFDPVHEGHLHAAACVREAFGLRRVALMPSAIPPHKPEGPTASLDDRLAMLRLALAGRPGLELCTWEADRGGMNYTIETLRALRRELHWDPLFILGTDALAELRTWRDPDALIAEFDLVAVDRPGRTAAQASARLVQSDAMRLVAAPGFPGAGIRATPPPGTGGRIFHLPIPPRNVSASEIRSRCAAGLPLADLVPPAVARYIRERSLYRQEAVR